VRYSQAEPCPGWRKVLNNK